MTLIGRVLRRWFYGHEHSTTFFLAGAAPNAVDLACCQRILQALASDRAARADGFCLLYLLQRRA
jgi:hypothetical protein